MIGDVLYVKPRDSVGQVAAIAPRRALRSAVSLSDAAMSAFSSLSSVCVIVSYSVLVM